MHILFEGLAGVDKSVDGAAFDQGERVRFEGLEMNMYDLRCDIGLSEI